MVALRDTEAAIRALREAFDTAERAGAPGVASVALAYEGVHHGLAGRLDGVHDCLGRLDARLADSRVDHAAWHLGLVLRLAVATVSDPETGFRAGKLWEETYIDSPVSFGVLNTAAAACVGDVEGTQWRLREAIRQSQERSADDGFPDWLIPLAVLAHAVGNVVLCRKLVTAIRRSPVPTHNFLHTIIYRQLRDRVGLAEQNSLDEQTIEEVFDEAMSWMDSLATTENSGPQQPIS